MILLYTSTKSLHSKEVHMYYLRTRIALIMLLIGVSDENVRIQDWNSFE